MLVRYALDAPAAGGQVSGTLQGASSALTGSVTVVETGRTYQVDADGEYLIRTACRTWTRAEGDELRLEDVPGDAGAAMR